MSLKNKTIRLAHSNPELRKHLLPLLEKESKYANESKPLLVMQTRGGRYKVEVTYDEKFGSYDYVSYTNGRSSGRGHQNTKADLLKYLAKTRFYALQYDKINYQVTVDEIGFERYYQSVTKTAQKKKAGKYDYGNFEIKFRIEDAGSNLRKVEGRVARLMVMVVFELYTDQVITSALIRQLQTFENEAPTVFSNVDGMLKKQGWGELDFKSNHIRGHLRKDTFFYSTAYFNILEGSDAEALSNALEQYYGATKIRN